MSLHTQRFLELIESTGLLSRLPEREVDIASAMRVPLGTVQAWLRGYPMRAEDLAAFEAALPALTSDLPAPPAAAARP